MIGFIVQSTLHKLIWSSEGLVHSDCNEQFFITNLVCLTGRRTDKGTL